MSKHLSAVSVRNCDLYLRVQFQYWAQTMEVPPDTWEKIVKRIKKTCSQKSLRDKCN
jgi:hypothetical protein